MGVRDEIKKAAEHFQRSADERGLPATSRLYIIKDFGGGWRVVVTPPHDIINHPIPGELVWKIPLIRIAEPVEWEAVEGMLRIARGWMELKLRKNRHGGWGLRP